MRFNKHQRTGVSSTSLWHRAQLQPRPRPQRQVWPPGSMFTPLKSPRLFCLRVCSDGQQPSRPTLIPLSSVRARAWGSGRGFRVQEGHPVTRAASGQRVPPSPMRGVEKEGSSRVCAFKSQTQRRCYPARYKFSAAASSHGRVSTPLRKERSTQS